MSITETTTTYLTETMDNYFHFYGLKRSGHHALIYWLVGCLPPTSNLFYANCIDWGKSPLLERNVNNLDFISVGGCRPVDHDLTPEKVDTLISSSEDIFSECWFRRFSVPANNIYEIVTIRDPFNNLASRFEMMKKKGAAMSLSKEKMVGRFPELWLSYYKTLGYKNNLNYNLWFKSEEYRKKWVDKRADWGLIFDDKYKNFISCHGGGSSFDGRQKRPSDMGVTVRWEKYKTDKEFLSLVTSNEEFISAAKSFCEECGLKEPINYFYR